MSVCLSEWQLRFKHWTDWALQKQIQKASIVTWVILGYFYGKGYSPNSFKVRIRFLEILQCVKIQRILFFNFYFTLSYMNVQFLVFYAFFQNFCPETTGILKRIEPTLITANIFIHYVQSTNTIYSSTNLHIQAIKLRFFESKAFLMFGYVRSSGQLFSLGQECQKCSIVFMLILLRFRQQ